MENILEFKNISKHFGGVNALDNVSFSIRKGEVHAIVGENGAGKSTLMNILGGLFLADVGEILMNGQQIHIGNPHIAHGYGISTVFQELKLCENLNLSENIFLGREIRKQKIGLDWEKMNQQASEVLKSYGLELSPTEQVQNLKVAQMQLVEIARAISSNSNILILDEPTSALTENETQKLFMNINRLKKSGVTIIFISHRLEEVFQISDTITVLRNGQYIGSYDKDEVTPAKTVELIAGRKIKMQEGNRCIFNDDKDVVLEVEGLSRGKLFNDVSFKLHRGEVLGFYGLQGSGRSELMETIYGMYKPDRGKIKLFGKDYKVKNVNHALDCGLALVPENRKKDGVFREMSVLENMVVSSGKRITRVLGFINSRKINEIYSRYSDKLRIKARSSKQLIYGLSGGNQQKVVLARVLSVEPEILLMDEPTRGVDIGAKSEIFTILQNSRKNENKSIVLVSSELEEIARESDRILIMRNGRICGELYGEEITKQNILHFAFNG